jgi:hypothetical protein
MSIHKNNYHIMEYEWPNEKGAGGGCNARDPRPNAQPAMQIAVARPIS